MTQHVLRIALAALVLASLSVARVQAHNPPIHRDLADLAYEIIALVERDQNAMHSFPAPMGTDSAKWSEFLRAVANAREPLRLLSSGLPSLTGSTCLWEAESDDWAANRPLKDMLHPLRLDYWLGLECGIDRYWTVKGIYTAANQSSGMPDYTGQVLGFWAASIDLHEDDTHLFVKRANMHGMGRVFDAADELANLGIALPLIPIACLFDCVFGDCEDCYKGALDFAETVNPVDRIINAIDVSSPDTVGVWHFLQMQPGAASVYDDRSGQLQEYSGPNGVPDPLTSGMIAAMDTFGVSLDWDSSRGPKFYEITAGNDFHRDTQARSAAEWELLPFVHLTFEPIDNLAKYGWDRYLESTGSAEQLGYALHALGDVTVPMHVVGSSGWGHRPFEDAVSNIWPYLLYQTDMPDELARAAQQQTYQARRILERAYRWYRFVQDWRTSHGALPSDVPVRDLVTELARETDTYARTQSGTGWPYAELASLQYLLDEQEAIRPYSTLQRIDQTRPLIENGVGAMLTFLVAAMGQ